jgi:hypothetical protein
VALASIPATKARTARTATVAHDPRLPGNRIARSPTPPSCFTDGRAGALAQGVSSSNLAINVRSSRSLRLVPRLKSRDEEIGAHGELRRDKEIGRFVGRSDFYVRGVGAWRRSGIVPEADSG